MNINLYNHDINNHLLLNYLEFKKLKYQILINDNIKFNFIFTIYF